EVSVSFPLGETTSISNSIFTGNSATGSGGAIEVGSSSVGNNLDVNFCRIVGNSAGTGNGLGNAGGLVDATENWWGCNLGPSSGSCDQTSGTVAANSWITLAVSPSPATINLLAVSSLSASFLQDNNGTALLSSDVSALVGLPITFNNSI